MPEISFNQKIYRIEGILAPLRALLVSAVGADPGGLVPTHATNAQGVTMPNELEA